MSSGVGDGDVLALSPPPQGDGSGNQHSEFPGSSHIPPLHSLPDSVTLEVSARLPAEGYFERPMTG